MKVFCEKCRFYGKATDTSLGGFGGSYCTYREYYSTPEKERDYKEPNIPEITNKNNNCPYYKWGLNHNRVYICILLLLIVCCIFGIITK